MSKQETISTITVETLILILNRILDELQTPSNVQKLEEARDNVGNEMLKMMQYLFPIVMQIQMEIIKDYGFSEGREGIIKFAQLLRNMERDDAEISRLHNLIKSHYLPPVNVNTCSELPSNDRITNN